MTEKSSGRAALMDRIDNPQTQTVVTATSTHYFEEALLNRVNVIHLTDTGCSTALKNGETSRIPVEDLSTNEAADGRR